MAVRPSPGLPAHLARSPGRVPRGYTLLQMEPSEGWWHPHDPPPLSARHLRGARASENLTHMREVSTVLCGDLTQVSTGPVMSLRLLWGDGHGGHPRTYRVSAHRPDLVRSSLGPRTHQNTQKSGYGVSTRGRDARGMDILRWTPVAWMPDPDISACSSPRPSAVPLHWVQDGVPRFVMDSTFGVTFKAVPLKLSPDVSASQSQLENRIQAAL